VASVELDRATLVAWYGDKPAPLVALVERLQRSAREVCGPGFTPRPAADVHATVLGLETPTGDAQRDLDGVLRYLAQEFGRAPLDVQFGGFADADRRMLSRGATLHERSLVLQGNTFVLVGWPMAPAPSAWLGEIRRRCEQYGFRHKYHRRAEDLDGDVYLVLGEVADPVRAGLVERLRSEVLTTPVRARLAVEDVALVEYVDARLPRATSTAIPLAPDRS
jgi:hypothetical protein